MKKQFTVTANSLMITSQELAQAVYAVDAIITDLVVNKVDLVVGVATVTIPEEQASLVSNVLGDKFLLSPNASLTY